MTARRRCTLALAGLAACTPRTQPIGEIDTEGGDHDGQGDASATDFTGTTEDDGAADSPDTVTFGPDPGCADEPPPIAMNKVFEFGPVDGEAPLTGTAMCTVIAGTSYDLDCTGDFAGVHHFEHTPGTTPELLFGAGVQTEVTYHAGGDSEWIRFTKEGYTMVLVQADRLAPTGISIDEWLPGLYAGTLEDAYCDPVFDCGYGTFIEYVGVWLSDAPDGTGPSTVALFAGETEVVGGDTYFEISLEAASAGECSRPIDAPESLWFVYRFEGPFAL